MTWSIVAVDADGSFGVAVASRFFAVGALCPHARSGAGALYVGPGWDGALTGIARHLAGEVTGDPVAAANSLDVQDFNVRSIEEWVAVVEASGTADAEAISTARHASFAQFAPDLVRPD